MLISVSVPLAGQDVTAAKSAAPDLMKRRLYKDAINVLMREIKGLDEPGGAKKYLMLGECHYMLKLYDKARPWFYKADKHLPAGDNKTVAQYRLACSAYRMGDRNGAIKRIDAFVAKHTSGRRTGTLLLFKMKLLTRDGQSAESAVEGVYGQLSGRGKASSRTAARTYGAAVRTAADKLMTDYYVAIGRQEKAMRMYASLVSGFRSVRSQYARERRPIPRGLEQAHDNAAMQLGLLHAKANRYDEAVKWLENVRYDTQLMRRARLLLAQVAYKRRDFHRAASYLTTSDFIETVPKGAMQSDMYLVLGLSEAARSGGDPRKVELYLQRVGPESGGYCQAQSQLGDLYREKGLNDRAIAAYKNAEASPKYEAHALYHMATLYLAQAKKQKDKKLGDTLFKQSAARFSSLGEKYPTSQLARLARKSMDELLSMGFDLTVARSDTEKIRHWMKLAQSQAGQAPAARALLSIARLHHKAIRNKKTQAYVKPPNYAACAAACDKLLDTRVYGGKDFDPSTWQSVRTEALYLRGRCHVTSASAGKAPRGKDMPTYLPSAKLGQAVADFQTARKLVDAKNLEMIKGIELGLLAAMLKSDTDDLRKTGRARFAELADEYGADPRFQQLAMDLADWYTRQGRLLEAAAEYKGIADRGASQLAKNDLLEALLAAGRLFSRSGTKALDNTTERKYGIYICPPEVFKVGGLLKTYRPFRKKIAVVWPEGAKDISAAQALGIVAKASGIKFVWDKRREFRKDSVGYYLTHKKLKFDGLSGTVREFLEQILDPATHRLARDIGLTDQKQAPPTGDAPDEPAIEIYDKRYESLRHDPLAKSYGSWIGAHGGGTAMMFNIIKRIESLTGTKVLWADGIDKDTILAAEFSRVPGSETHKSLSCGQTLATLLGTLEMRFRIIPRNQAAEIFARAKDCYNDIRRVDPRSKHGEQSLFLLAMDFYRQKDFERMKIVLKEYLKLFDDPENKHYHEACFWVGWVFENDKRLREACYWYNRAAGEQLVVYKIPGGKTPPTKQQLRALCSYDTLFALEESTPATFKDATLGEHLSEFVRLRSNVDVRLDLDLPDTNAPIKDRSIEKTKVIDVLHEILGESGLSFRVENVNPKVAQKAYYRMASACNDDGMLEQALNACDLVLRRFPSSSRRRDAFRLKLEICKGMKDYRTVLATMEQLRKELAGDVEAYQIDFEIAWIYFELCDYKRARSYFQKSLAAAKAPIERTKIRDGYARACLQSGDFAEALTQYRSLLKTESQPLRKFIDRLMVWYLVQVVDPKTTPPKLPADAAKLMRWYTELSDQQRARLPANILAKATWIYYIAGRLDHHRKRTDLALERFQAAGNSPDDWLAAEALYCAGMIHVRSGRVKEAVDAFQYMLISTKSTEGQVRALYTLAQCQQSLGNTRKAKMRFDQILNRFPDSPYAARARAKRSETQPASKPQKP
jgi:outer membrane protein assembly factor BamD (BamD/ComL family)